MKNTIKNGIAILLCCMLAFSLFACSKEANLTDSSSDTSGVASDTTEASAGSSDTSADTSSDVPVKDTLNVALSQDSGTLDPMFNIGWDCIYALRMIYEPLWEFDDDNNIIYVLADNLEKVSGTVWHITLKEGITFADGSEFNADDVLFTINRANNRPGATALLTNVLEDQCKKIDDYTVEVVFEQFVVSEETNVWGTLFMFDAETFSEDTVATATNGTGPYVMTEQIINSQWTLESRDDYWDDTPAMKTLTFKFLAEDTQMVNAIQTGTVDICSVPFQDITYVQSLDNVEVNLIDSGYSKCVYMNLDPRSPFYNNDDARRAVAYAIDSEAIVNLAYSGFANISRMPIALGQPDQEDRFLDLGIYGEGRDVEKAKALAESSGLVDKEILLINNGTSDSMIVAEIIQENLREIGVTVEIWTLDTGSWLGVVFDATQYDMAVDFTMGSSVAGAYNMWYTMAVGGSYTTQEWDGCEIFREFGDVVTGIEDTAERSDIVMEMTGVLADSVPWFSFADMQSAMAYDKDLKGFHVLNSGNTDYSKISW